MTTQPARIQQQRTKGWRKPPNTRCEGRGTKFGNYVSRPKDKSFAAHAAAVEAYREWVFKLEQAEFRAMVWRELRGKNLMCWCPDGWPCHADVLLEIANREEST
jgi:hypothetical protein